MKKILFSLIAIGVNSVIAFSQQLKPNTIIKGKSDSFITKQYGYGEKMYVVNSKNGYYKKAANHANINSAERVDKYSILNAFEQVFSIPRLKQLLPENYLAIQLYVNPSGKVLEVMFNLNKNTLVTATELEAIEKIIKNNVSYKLKPEETKAGEFFVVTEIVKYSWVLDRTQK